MARTWAIKEDSVNTSIIHWYSTLPRNGRIHRLSKNTGKKQKVLGQVGFVRVGWIRKQKTELVGSEELKPIVGEPMSVVQNHPALCPASPDRYAVMPIYCRRDRNRSAKRHLVIPSTTLLVVDIFSQPIFPEMTQSRTK